LIENYFSYMGSSYKSDDIGDWECFEMDNEGHLVSIRSKNFPLSNESIELLSNFPHLRCLNMFLNSQDTISNFSLISNLKTLDI